MRLKKAARGLILAAAVVVGVASPILLHAAFGHRLSSLPDAGALPAFSLVDQNGKSFTQDSLSDHVWVVDFIFTRCAGQCPWMTQRLAGLAAEFKFMPRLRFASISVDPAYDTPQRLAAYARQVEADASRWIFLTGPQDAVFALSREGFHLAVSQDGMAKEPVTHSVRLVLVDAHGHIRGYYDATDAAKMKQLKQHIRRLAKES